MIFLQNKTLKTNCYIRHYPDKSEHLFFLLLNRKYVVGIQKKLIETVLLSTQSIIMFKLIGKKIETILRSEILRNLIYAMVWLTPPVKSV